MAKTVMWARDWVGWREMQIRHSLMRASSLEIISPAPYYRRLLMEGLRRCRLRRGVVGVGELWAAGTVALGGVDMLAVEVVRGWIMVTGVEVDMEDGEVEVGSEA